MTKTDHNIAFQDLAEKLVKITEINYYNVDPLTNTATFRCR
jgi:hypothetical protein